MVDNRKELIEGAILSKAQMFDRCTAISPVANRTAQPRRLKNSPGSQHSNERVMTMCHRSCRWVQTQQVYFYS